MTPRTRDGAGAARAQAASGGLPGIAAACAPVFARLPQHPPAVLAAIATNLVLGDAISGERIPEALGRTVAIVVRDAGLELRFTVVQGGIAAAREGTPDATVSADTADLVALARREVDPDMLFFGRRLMVEGDTALAHLLMNTIAAAEPRWAPPTPRRLLRALRLQLPGLVRVRTR